MVFSFFPEIDVFYVIVHGILSLLGQNGQDTGKIPFRLLMDKPEFVLISFIILQRHPVVVGTVIVHLRGTDAVHDHLRHILSRHAGSRQNALNDFALSMMINPEKQAAEEIERMLCYPGFLKRETLPRGRMEIIELRIDAKSKLKDISLNELISVVRCKILICCVIRQGELIAPSGDFVSKEGDRIFVTATTDDLTTLLKNLRIITQRVKNVMICGGGRVTYYLASRLLSTGVNVHIIEQDEALCRDMAMRLPKANIILGDATDRDLLDGEGLAKCDALVTMTGMDEVNMVVSMYGCRCGVDQVITKLSHEGNSTLLDSLDLGKIICPKELCSNTIVQYVNALDNQTGAALAVHSFAGGKTQAFEFVVDDQTRNCHTPLKKLRIRKNILIVGIKHGPLTVIPDGDSMYEKGDILVVVSGQGAVTRLNDIFE